MYCHSTELYHYGIKGQKWGVRRYQNEDGTLTAEGRKRIKAENEKAFKLGRDATVYGRAVERGKKKIIKTENKIDKWYEKHPSSDDAGSSRLSRLQNKWREQATTTLSLADKYAAALGEAQRHCNQLISEYGAENVTPIRYKTAYSPRLGSYSMINEKTTSGKEIVESVLATAGSVGLMALGLPVGVIVTPTSTSRKARQVYNKELVRTRQGKNQQQSFSK